MDFFLFRQVSCEFSKEIAPKRGEICPISGRRKQRRILSRLWAVMVLSVPDSALPQNNLKSVLATTREAHLGAEHVK